MQKVTEKSDSYSWYIAKIASTVSERQKIKYYLQGLARKLLPNERVVLCHRSMRPRSASVDVMWNRDSGRSYYKNLIVCGRIWQCPVCAGRITEKRRQELLIATSSTTHGTALITYTLRHKQGDSLVDLFKALKEAHRAMKAGRWWQENIVGEYAYIGSVTSLEVTYGENGWHPHLHELAFFQDDINGYEQGLHNLLSEQWQKQLDKRGHDASWERGIDVTSNDGKIKEYVAKWGHLPEGIHWTVESEVTKAPTKRGSHGGKAPLELLMDYGGGDLAAGDLFVEYVNAFKNAHQLQWSRGLRAKLGLGVEKSDEALAEEEIDPVDFIIASLSRDQWKIILEKELRADLIEIAAHGDPHDLWKWLEMVGVTPVLA